MLRLNTEIEKCASCGKPFQEDSVHKFFSFGKDWQSSKNSSPTKRKKNKNTSHVTLGHQTCVHLDFSLPLPSKLVTSNSLDLLIVEEKIW
jgi:hypothetical protein